MSSRVAGKESARARATEARAAQARAARRRKTLLAGGAIGLVVLVVAGLIVAKLAGVGGSSGTDSATPADSGLASAAVVKAVTTVPAATLDSVGAGDVGAGNSSVVPSKIDAPKLTVDGLPQFLYVGANYCPFCASQRWAVVVALSRFGTWSSLGATSSGSTDVHPNTQTLSFHGASFTSKYVSFTGVETRGNTIKNGEYEPLDSMNPADQKVFDTYNRPPYVKGSTGAVPFIDIAGRYVNVGSGYGPELLKGKSREQIAAALADPESVIGRAVAGSANVLTAAVCEATGQNPATVCGSAGVKAAAARLAAGG